MHFASCCTAFTYSVEGLGVSGGIGQGVARWEAAGRGGLSMQRNVGAAAERNAYKLNWQDLQ